MDTATILTKARDMIADRDHWGKGLKRLRLGTYCAAEAIEATAPTEAYRCVKALRRIVGYPIPAWNDDPGRTHDEVLEAFGRAIAAATEHP